MNKSRLLEKILCIMLSICITLFSFWNCAINTVKAESINDDYTDAEVDDDDDYDDDYEDDYDDDEDYDDFVDVFCNTSNMTLYVGQKKTISVEVDDDYDTDNELIWWSSDTSIATVDDDGTVTGLKEGKVTITVQYGNSKDKCTVVVKKKTPTYKQALKKIKQLNKKNKKLLFKNVDVGNCCRLYADYSLADTTINKWRSQGYMTGGNFLEYIEIRKKGSGSVAKLVVDSIMVQANYLESVDLTASELKLNTSNRKLSFELDEINSKSYVLHKIYYGKSRAKATIASSSDKKTSVLKKYNAMLGQKSFSLKFQCNNGAYFKIWSDKKTRKSWKRLNKVYSKLLKIY